MCSPNILIPKLHSLGDKPANEHSFVWLTMETTSYTCIWCMLNLKHVLFSKVCSEQFSLFMHAILCRSSLLNTEIIYNSTCMKFDKMEHWLSCVLWLCIALCLPWDCLFSWMGCVHITIYISIVAWLFTEYTCSCQRPNRLCDKFFYRPLPLQLIKYKQFKTWHVCWVNVILYTIWLSVAFVMTVSFGNVCKLYEF